MEQICFILNQLTIISIAAKHFKGENVTIRSMFDDYDEDMQAMTWKRADKSISTSLFGAFKHPGSLSLPQSPAFFEKETHAKDAFDGSFHKSGKEYMILCGKFKAGIGFVALTGVTYGVILKIALLEALTGCIRDHCD